MPSLDLNVTPPEVKNDSHYYEFIGIISSSDEENIEEPQSRTKNSDGVQKKYRKNKNEKNPDRKHLNRPKNEVKNDTYVLELFGNISSSDEENIDPSRGKQEKLKKKETDGMQKDYHKSKTGNLKHHKQPKSEVKNNTRFHELFGISSSSDEENIEELKKKKNDIIKKIYHKNKKEKNQDCQRQKLPKNVENVPKQNSQDKEQKIEKKPQVPAVQDQRLNARERLRKEFTTEPKKLEHVEKDMIYFQNLAHKYKKPSVPQEVKTVLPIVSLPKDIPISMMLNKDLVKAKEVFKKPKPVEEELRKKKSDQVQKEYYKSKTEKYQHSRHQERPKNVENVAKKNSQDKEQRKEKNLSLHAVQNQRFNAKERLRQEFTPEIKKLEHDEKVLSKTKPEPEEKRKWPTCLPKILVEKKAAAQLKFKPVSSVYNADPRLSALKSDPFLFKPESYNAAYKPNLQKNQSNPINNIRSETQFNFAQKRKLNDSLLNEAKRKRIEHSHPSSTKKSVKEEPWYVQFGKLFPLDEKFKNVTFQ